MDYTRFNAILMLKAVTCTTLFDLAADSVPTGPVPAIHMHPDPYRLTDEMGLRNRMNEATVATIVAVIAHDEIMSNRHLECAIRAFISRICNEYLVLSLAELFNESRIVHGRVCVFFQVNALTINRQHMALISNSIAWQANDSLDVVDTRI